MLPRWVVFLFFVQLSTRNQMEVASEKKQQRAAKSYLRSQKMDGHGGFPQLRAFVCQDAHYMRFKAGQMWTCYSLPACEQSFIGTLSTQKHLSHNVLVICAKIIDLHCAYMIF